VYFLAASEMYCRERSELEHCALSEDLSLQKPISTDNLIKEVNRKIDSK
jgi:hypothetical protein